MSPGVSKAAGFSFQRTQPGCGRATNVGTQPGCGRATWVGAEAGTTWERFTERAGSPTVGGNLGAVPNTQSGSGSASDGWRQRAVPNDGSRNAGAVRTP